MSLRRARRHLLFGVGILGLSWGSLFLIERNAISAIEQAGVAIIVALLVSAGAARPWRRGRSHVALPSRIPPRYYVGAALDASCVALLVGVPMWLVATRVGLIDPGVPAEIGQLGAAAASSLFVGTIIAGRWINRLSFPDGLRSSGGRLPVTGMWNEPGNFIEMTWACALAVILLGLSASPNVVGLVAGTSVFIYLFGFGMLAGVFFFLAYVED